MEGYVNMGGMNEKYVNGRRGGTLSRRGKEGTNLTETIRQKKRERENREGRRGGREGNVVSMGGMNEGYVNRRRRGKFSRRGKKGDREGGNKFLTRI